MAKKWYADWRLSVSTAPGISNNARVVVNLPHASEDLQNVVAYNDSADVKQLANLIDKLLCELTGTKTHKVLRQEDGLHTDLPA